MTLEKMTAWLSAVAVVLVSLMTVTWARPPFNLPLFPAAGRFVIADLNGDGHRDLDELSSDGVVTLLGRGDGTFGSPFPFTTGDHPWVLTTADFNGDLVLDVAVAMRTGQVPPDWVAILLGNGDGTFRLQSQQALSTSFFPSAIVSADFTSDGVPDLAIASEGYSGLVIFQGRGDGDFDLLSEDLSLVGMKQVLATDLNGDGVQDLLIQQDPGSGPSQVDALLGLGDGTFQPSRTTTIGNGFSAMSLGDFNGDGIPDLAATTFQFHNDGVLRLFLGDGIGTFAPAPQQVSVSDYPGWIATGDFNGDGRADVAVASTLSAGSDSGVATFLGNGSGALTPADKIFIFVPGFPAVGDFDEDTRQDLALIAFDRTSILFGGGDGTFAADKYYDTGFFPNTVVVADFDGDGRDDLAVANDDSQQPVTIMPGRGDGTFGSVAAAAPAGAAGPGPAPQASSVIYRENTLAAGDFNGDGLADIVRIDSPGLHIQLSQGGGHLGPPIPFTAGDNPFGVAVGDFNADGHADVAVANNGSRNVSVRLGLGDGTLGPELLLVAGFGPSGIIVDDFNADSRADLAVSNLGDGTVSVFLGHGDGTFDVQRRSTVGSFPSGLASGDFDGDGFKDLVATNERSDDVSVLLNRGNGTFGLQTRYGVGAGPHSVVARDFDLDGRVDIAVANLAGGDGTQQGAFSVLPGLGDGSFGPEMRFRAGASPMSLAAGDFNRDGRSDLVLANYREGDVIVKVGQPPLPVVGQPVADAGADQTLECSSPAGAPVTLDGSGSSDPASTPGTNDALIAFDWFENYGLPSQVALGSGAVFQTVLPLGAHLVTLQVTDRLGATAVDDAIVTVSDTRPPVISLTLSPTVLWPAFHQLVTTTATVAASDLCGGTTVLLASVTSSEPDDAPGGNDGKTIGDIQGAAIGTADFSFSLRAERDSRGAGRVYTVVYQAIDGSGNAASALATVTVPHDSGGVTDPMPIAVHTSVNPGTVVSWDTVPGALGYNVIRGALSSLRETVDTIDLGAVVCIVGHTTATDTSGHEDAADPAIGTGFFYLGGYDDGVAILYGSSSSGKPMAPASGDCL